MEANSPPQNGFKINPISGLYYSPKWRSRMKGQPSYKKTRGFCTNSMHFGKLSKKMIKDHDCVHKCCPYFRDRRWCKEHKATLDKKKPYEEKFARAQRKEE